MYNELVTTMQTEHCSLSQADFFGENVFNKPIPVPVLESAQALVRNDDSDIYNLDQELSQPQDESFYQNEDTSYGTKRLCARSIYQCKNGVYGQITVKQEPLNSESQQFSNEEQYHFWNMQSKILSECVQDVRDTCRRLCICPDPTRWSCVQVQQWIDWQCLQFRLPQPHMESFFMPGSQLCNLTEEHFRMFAPEAGSTLYSQLDIWRSVVEQTTFNGCANNIFQLTHIPTPTSSPSLGSVSPSPSVWSEESQPSSSPKQLHQIVRSTAVTEEDSDRLPEEPIHHHRQTIQLWQFLKLLLLDGNYSDCIRWVDKPRGIFKIENSSRVAKLWGKRKNRPAMNYDKLSRSIRQYYKKNIIKKTEHSKRLVYQFCHL